MKAATVAAASAALFLPTATAQCASPSTSVTSCGGASDHLKNVCIQLSPDPIQRGQPFTLTLSGDLDADVESGAVDIDLNVKAGGGIIDDKVTKAAPFTLSPGVKKGNQKIVIGPVSLPTDVPGEGSISGKVAFTAGNKEPVACVNLDLNVPAFRAVDAAVPQGLNETVRAGGDPVWTDCTQSSDHLKNLKLATADGVSTATGTFDEDITKMEIDVDLKAHKLFVTLPLKLTIPISYSPGIAQGDFKATIGPEENALTSSLGGVALSGTVKLNDGNAEEIACLSVDTPKAESEQIVV